jgi:hypothetical protein
LGARFAGLLAYAAPKPIWPRSVRILCETLVHHNAKGCDDRFQTVSVRPVG